MILVDANLLIYAYDLASPFHSEARKWLVEAISSETTVGVSWSGIQAFLRYMTNPRFPGRPTPEAAMHAVSDWLAEEHVVVLAPGPRHWQILSSLIGDARAYGPLITDAHIAALAIEHGATLCTHDRDFARFPKLKIEYPLS